ncbi:hypothetical protein ACO0QE_001454 [Hanseniaspora vineae]
MSSSLTSNGVLAQIWLAANLDRKFNKHQYVQTDLVSSSKEIARAAAGDEDDVEQLGLRISGHLLYGVVRIYSSKTKYLLDDITETLVKLKSAFKANPKQVTQAVGSTVVSNMNNLIMHDTITAAELFYQEPLHFLSTQEIPEGLLHRGLQGAQATSDFSTEKNRNLAGTGAANFNAGAIPNIETSNENHIDYFEDSLEIGRGYAINLLDDNEIEKETYHNNLIGDQDFDLDFDISGQSQNVLEEGTAKSLNSAIDASGPSQHGTLAEHEENSNNLLSMEHSVELGRNNEGEDNEQDPLFDMDLGLDYTEAPNDQESSDNRPLSLEQQETNAAHTAQQQALPSFPSKSILKNTKEILKDDQIEITTTEDENDSENAIFNTPTNSPPRKEKSYGTKRLLEQMYEQTYDYLPQTMYQTLLQLGTNFPQNKRQKHSALLLNAPPSPEENEHSDISFGSINSDGIDISLNLGKMHGSSVHLEESNYHADIEGPFGGDTSDIELHEHSDIEGRTTLSGENSQNDQILQLHDQMDSKTTVEVANMLRQKFENKGSAVFSELLHPAYGEEQVTKSEASKTFFQLLSLATADCISVQQSSLFGEISVKEKSGLKDMYPGV